MDTLNRQNSFGGLERVQKPQDVLIGSFAPTTTPESYIPDYTFFVEDQHQTPSCGAHAGDSMKNTLEQSFRGSPEYLWKAMRLVDGLSPDIGSNMLTIMDRLAKRGICSFPLMPNNADVTNIQYADPWTLEPVMDTDAQNHKIGTYAFTFNPTFQQIKDAIYQHKGAILMMNVGAEWWTAENGQSSWAEKDILPLDPNREPVTSGHFVFAYGFDSNFIYFINSWSSQWARNGIGYFASNYSYRVKEMGVQVDPQAKYVFIKVLRLGSIGYDVKQLQTKLGIIADGIFGNQTLEAVKKFQTQNGLTPDGVVGQLTNAKLNQ